MDQLTAIQKLAHFRAKLNAGELGAGLLSALLEAFSDSAEVRAIVRLASRTGIELRHLLALLAEHFEFDERLRDQAKVAESSIRQTRLILFALPAVTTVFAQLSGFETLPFLCGTVLGWLCLLVSGALVWLANQSLKKQLALASRPSEDPGFEYSLLAECLRVGATWPQALSFVFEPQLREQSNTAGELLGSRFDDFSTTSHSLRAKAKEMRHEAELRALKTAAKLPEKLVTTTAGYLLPACLVISVVPTAVGALRLANLG